MTFSIHTSGAARAAIDETVPSLVHDLVASRITGGYDDARAVFAGIAELGIDFTDITQVLEDEGVAKFIDSWHDLLAQVTEALESQR